MSEQEEAIPPSSPPAPLPAPKEPARKQENPLLNILLNVLLPVTVLSACGGKDKFYSLGPQLALIVAVLLPVGYFIWDYRERRKVNAFSIIGFVSVVITGGLGLLKLNAQVFGIKEASVPLILAFIIWWTGRGEKPMVRTLLLNPDIVDVRKVETAITVKEVRPEFDRLIKSSTWLLSGAMLISAALNYFLAIYFISGTEHDEELYTAAIGKQTGWGWVVIGVPIMVMMLYAMMRLFKGVKRLTGLDTDDILLPR